MTTATHASPSPAGAHDLDVPEWWRQAAVYQIYPRSFADRERRRSGRHPRHHLARAVPRGARHRRGVAEPVLPVRTGGRRLRRRRLPQCRPAARHAGGLRRARGGAARGGHPRRRRHRAEPHVRPARVVPGGARRRARVGGARPLHLPRGHRAGRRRAAHRLGLAVRRVRVGAGRRRAVVPASLRRRAARPELVQPRGARRLRADAALLVGSRRRRLPHRRGPHAHEGPLRAAALAGASSTPCPGTDCTPRSTATTCTRSTRSGVRCSTRTTRRAPPWPRRGSTARACRSTPAPRASVRRSTSSSSRRTSTPTSSVAS